MTCIHHYILDDPPHPVRGVCKKCGAEKWHNPDPDMRGAFDWRDAAITSRIYKTTRAVQQLAEERL